MKKVLLIEDDPLFRKSLLKLIASEGFAVTGAGSGEEGIGMFETEQADLVLLDYDLPGMTGLDVARMLKRRSPAIPVILLSATLPEEARIAAREERIGPVLRKSSDNLVSLMRIITETLRAGPEPRVT